MPSVSHQPERATVHVQRTANTPSPSLRAQLVLSMLLISVSAACARSHAPAQVPQQTPEADQVTLRTSHSAKAVSIRDPGQVQALLTEVHQLRQRPWESAPVIAHGCMAQAAFWRGHQPVLKLIVYSDRVYAPLQGKKNPQPFAMAGAAELPRLHKAIADFGGPAGYKW
jgi:hypothetical protein